MGYRERGNYPGASPCPGPVPIPCPSGQRHVHELQGSVKLADQHEHRFCTVTEEACPVDVVDHYHEVCFRTDFHNDHYHEFKGKTGCAIPVGDRHVHYIESVTSVDDGHRHNFEAATMIENPTGRDYKKDYCPKDDHDHYHHRDGYRR